MGEMSGVRQSGASSSESFRMSAMSQRSNSRFNLRKGDDFLSSTFLAPVCLAMRGAFVRQSCCLRSFDLSLSWVIGLEGVSLFGVPTALGIAVSVGGCGGIVSYNKY